MKKILIVLVMIFTVISCSDDGDSNVVVEFPNYEVKYSFKTHVGSMWTSINNYRIDANGEQISFQNSSGIHNEENMVLSSRTTGPGDKIFGITFKVTEGTNYMSDFTMTITDIDSGEILGSHSESITPIGAPNSTHEYSSLTIQFDAYEKIFINVFE